MTGKNRPKIYLVLYAATTRMFVNVIGRLMLAELISLASLPFMKIKSLFNYYKGLRIVVVGLVFLLTSQIISDLWNDSVPGDYLRGWAMIFFSIISTIFFVKQLSQDSNNVLFYLFALFLVNLFFGSGEIDPNLLEQDTNYFKSRFVGFLNPVIMVGVYFIYNKINKKLSIFILLIYGLICMGFDARSNGLIFIFSAVIIYLVSVKIHISRIKIYFFSIIFGFFAYLGYVYYVNQVLYNHFGGNNAFNQLKRSSNPYNPFDLIYVGRADFIVLVQAIKDKPVFGHGSWGKDHDNKYAKMTSKISGIKINNVKGYISAHSVLLGSWAYTGVIGFLSVCIIYFYLFRRFFQILKYESYYKILPIIIILSTDMIWAFFFSPFGLLRTTFPIFAALIITSDYELTTLNVVNEN